MLGFKTKKQILLESLEYRIMLLEERLKYVEDVVKVRSLKQKRVNAWHSPEDMT